jgi:hypothetical protein
MTCWTGCSTPSIVPMAPTHYRYGEVASDDDKVALTPSGHDTFRTIIGYVNFVCMCTIPGIAFAITVISMRHAAPTQLHLKQFKRPLRYLNGTRSMGIIYGQPSQKIWTTSRCSYSQIGQLTQPPSDQNMGRWSYLTKEQPARPPNGKRLWPCPPHRHSMSP